MQQKNYQRTIMVNAAPAEAYQGIKDVKAWWAKKVEGRSAQRWDVFTVRFGETFVTFEIVEDDPEKKIVWDVRDCNLHWQNDKKEWNGTRVVFEIAPAGECTKVTMTHVGLAPGAECYENCRQGWNEHIGESLVNYINHHAGMPV
ncbi:MAG TPA: SRPBCC domain-containing protein [Puia sp.]